MERVSVNTSDNVSLSVRIYRPEVYCSGQPVELKGGVIINSATGVKQGYYRSFAEFLAAKGYAVITYDYRGIGESLNLSYRDSRLTMFAWGEKDFEAIIDKALELYPNLDWHCVGHSVGGQIIGLAKNNQALTSAFNVAAQSGNWRFWKTKFKFQLVPTWYVLIPVLSRILGYFPGSIIGGEHLPKQVALDWAKWCRNKNYICDAKGKPYRPYFNQLTMPMHFLILDDDHAFAPEQAVRALAGFYENAETTLSKTTHHERQGKFLGHFGFFRQKHEALLWSKIFNWLENQAELSLSQTN